MKKRKQRRKVHVRSHQGATSLGSKVWVGVVEENGDVYLKFTTPRGRETRLGLSREAMDLLHSLWLSRLRYEDAWAYKTVMFTKRYPPMVPYAWAGIPPVDDPYGAQVSHNEGGTWVKVPPGESVPEGASMLFKHESGASLEIKGAADEKKTDD